MASLQETGIDEAIRSFQLGQARLGICLGLQISELLRENQTKTLDLISGEVKNSV